MAIHHRRRTGRGGVLHVADGLSEPVFSLLGPAVAALHEAGMVQTVVLLDRPEHADRIRQFGEGTHVVHVMAERHGLAHWAALRHAVRKELRLQRPDALHCHGTLAWLCSLGLAGREQSVYVTPYGSTLARLVGALLRLQRGATLTPTIPVASSRFDSLALQQGDEMLPELDGVVDERFLRAPRREAHGPLVVAACHRGTVESVDLFCRVAVVFGAAELRLKFRWCGVTQPESEARLLAAGVTIDSGDPLLQLQRAWVYLAGGHETQFPVRLAQAMACGLPCLAVDVPAHRGLIEDGRSGLLFRSTEEAVQMLTELIDSPDMRRDLGGAARAVARQRFSAHHLRRDLVALYAGPPSTSSELGPSAGDVPG